MERVPEGVARFHPRPLLKYGDVPENPVADPPLFPPPPYSLAWHYTLTGSLYRSHLISRDYVGISLFPGSYAEMRTTIIDRNAGYVCRTILRLLLHEDCDFGISLLALTKRQSESLSP
jgi:hypothetical protein